MTKEKGNQKIFYMGDTHGNITHITQAVFLFKKLKQENPKALSVFCGDFLGPTLQSSFSQGNFDVFILKQIYKKHKSVIGLGNHDFDHGEKRLIELLVKLNVPVVVTNINFLNVSSSLTNLFKPFYLIKNQNEHYVFMGLLPYEMKYTSNSFHSFEVLNFQDTVTLIKENINYLSKLQPEKNLRFIMISHLGIDLDKQLAQKITNILILGGHSHTLEKMYFNKDTNSGVAHAGCNAHHIGSVEIDTDKNNFLPYRGEHYSVIQAQPQDLNTQNYLNKLNFNLKKLRLYKELIYLRVKPHFSGLDWNAKRDNHNGQARHNDTFITRIMADAMVEAIEQETHDKGYIGLFHGGGVRSYLPSGSITLADIHAVFPFPQYLVTLEMTGKDLVIALELGLGLTNWNQRAGILHPSSSLIYGYDLTKPRGSRLDFVEIHQQKINLQKIYKIVTNNWIAEGKDGQEIFVAHYQHQFKKHPHLKQADVFSHYLQSHKQKIANEEIVDWQEQFGKRIKSSISLDEAREIAKQNKFARGNEKMLQIKEVKLKKFL